MFYISAFFFVKKLFVSFLEHFNNQLLSSVPLMKIQLLFKSNSSCKLFTLVISKLVYFITFRPFRFINMYIVLIVVFAWILRRRTLNPNKSKSTNLNYWLINYHTFIGSKSIVNNSKNILA